MKRVVSLQLPFWPVDRLCRAEPSAVPAHKPFALVGSGAHGLTITAVNPVAAREGIYPGLSLADARAAIPALISRRAETEQDRIALLKLARWAGRYGPCRHTEGADGLWIDISGVAHLFGGEAALLDDLIGRLRRFGVSARAGLADTHGAAHALARYGVARGATTAIAPHGATRAALSVLPVEALRLESDSVVLLKRLGLRRIGDLYDLPRDSLARRFRSKDKAGRVLDRLDEALGFKDEPRRPLVEPPVLSAQSAFAEPLISSQGLIAAVEVLCAEVCDLLAAKAHGARAIRLTLYRADGTSAEAFAAMSLASREARHIFRLIEEKLGAVDAGFGVDLIRCEVVRAERLAEREEAFAGPGVEVANNPAFLLDRLSNRLGADAITVPSLRPSHLPERAEVRLSAMPSLKALETVEAGGHRFKGDAAPLYEPSWPYECKGPRRPPFLLPRPEPIAVIAEVPDGPPARFTWRRVERRVARAEGPERLAPEWWRHLRDETGTRPARPRDYYMIEDETGAAYWVFRHGLYGRDDDDGFEDAAPPSWFLHGLFA